VKSPTPRHAVSDFLRSLGCNEDEMEPIGANTIAWRGAVYKAVKTDEADSREDASETADGSNYRVAEDPGAEIADGSNYRDDA
jgi:hypothetical protein